MYPTSTLKSLFGLLKAVGRLSYGANQNPSLSTGTEEYILYVTCQMQPPRISDETPVAHLEAPRSRATLSISTGRAHTTKNDRRLAHYPAAALLDASFPP